MRSHLGMKVFLMLFLSVNLQPSFAVDCNSPPTGYGGSWARAYAAWCQQCGGIYNPSNQSCRPSSNWGSGSPGATPSYNDEAERQRREAEHQRQMELEQRRQRELGGQHREEAEAARKKQEEFQHDKQEAIQSMKGIAEGELGLKSSDAGELGLKDTGDTEHGLGLKEIQASASKPKTKKMQCEWGTLDSSVVDLRCLGLDPDKPITVDPRIVRGEERAFPAQPDPETFKNTNYNKGFEALMRFDAASAGEAVRHFQEAQKERPKDPLVRNGLLLAQDILKARKQKERDDLARASYFTLQSYSALMMGDNEKARGYIAQARLLAPKDNNAKFVESLAKNDLGKEGSYSARKDAYRLVANGLVSVKRRNLSGALRMLEAAQRLQPRDKFINEFILELQKFKVRK